MKFTIGTSDSKNVKVDAMVLADTRALINASSGLGKSWLMRLIAESVASSIQTIIVDPEGEYPTLREKFDLLIVSENGDLRADISSARLLARKLAETGVSAVLDIYDLPGKEDPWLKRRMFVAELISEWMNLPKKLWHPMIMMVDEAHQFAQEKPSNDWMMWNGKKVYPALLSRSAIRSLMSAGRKRGMGGILATQRISKIDKDSIADVRNWFIGGSTLDIDQQRAGDILGMSKAEAVALRDLEPGTFYSFGPAIDGKGITQFTSGQVQTTHPKAGQRASIVVPKASTQIAGIAEQFGDLPAAAEEEIETLTALKKDNADLRRQLRERPVQVKPEPQIQRVEVPVVTDEQIQALGNALGELKGSTDKFDSFLKDLDELIFSRIDDVRTATSEISTAIANAKKPAQAPYMGLDVGKGRDRTAKAIVRTDQEKNISSVDEITGPQQRVIDAIAWMEAIGIYKPKRSIVAFLAGYTEKSTSFTNPLGALRSAGLISYPNSDSVDLTEAGRAAANPQERPLTTKELHNAIFAKLPSPQVRILRVLIDHYPNAVDREWLAEQAGYTVKSTSFTNPLGALRSLGVIGYPSSSEAIALPVLFLEK
jgi:hypothetical protein